MPNRSLSVAGVIPARYDSTRFPGKPLALLHGRPMIEWVVRAAKKALRDVWVATDDKRILKTVQGFGGQALLTPRSCPSGTDRVFFASKKIKARFFVNIQGDEPLIQATTIRRAVTLAQTKKAMATVCTPLKANEKADPHVVKVLLGGKRRALYFSRSMMPGAFKHLGLYVYPKELLASFVSWPQPLLEKTEKLEQLRVLHYGHPIYVATVRDSSIGVDTPDDLKKVETILNKRSLS